MTYPMKIMYSCTHLYGTANDSKNGKNGDKSDEKGRRTEEVSSARKALNQQMEAKPDFKGTIRFVRFNLKMKINSSNL